MVMTGWGGPRDGAGRKPQGKNLVMVAFKLEADQADKLKQLAADKGKTLSDIIRAALKRTVLKG